MQDKSLSTLIEGPESIHRICPRNGSTLVKEGQSKQASGMNLVWALRSRTFGVATIMPGLLILLTFKEGHVIQLPISLLAFNIAVTALHSQSHLWSSI